METPKNVRQTRPTRNPTPRLSERKKSLFAGNALHESVDSADFLEGIELLDATQNGNDACNQPNNTANRSISALLGGRGEKRAISFFDSEPEKEDNMEWKPRTRRSLRVMLPKISVEAINTGLEAPHHNVNKENADAENAVEEGTEEQLQKLFRTSMRLGVHGHGPDALEVGSDTDCRHNFNGRKESHKRHPEQISGTSPQRKIAKVSTPPDAHSISTKIFYSAPKKLSEGILDINKEHKVAASTTSVTCSTTSPRSRARHDRRNAVTTNINRGVRHKIRPRPRSLGLGAGVRHLPSLDVDLILNNMRNDKLKRLIASKREERLQIEKVHNIFRNSRNPIAMARPLSTISGLDDSNNNDSRNKSMNDYGPLVATHRTVQSRDPGDREDLDFSDIECDDDGKINEQSRAESQEEEVIPLINHQWSAIKSVVEDNEQDHRKTPLCNRKFFKSGRASHIPKQVNITDNIKASVCNGKISLIQEQRKIPRRPRLKQSATIEFSDEQATVDAILKNLDDTAFGDVEATECSIPADQGDCGKECNPQVEAGAEAENVSLNTIQLQDDINYAEFRKRLPYNTSDPEVMEQQHLLLDFLISNHICTEENFIIFIADPDNHKEEAARIVDQVIVVVNKQSAFRQRLPYKTSDPEIAAQQHERLDFLVENGICTEENFAIFIANYEQRRSEAEAIVAAIEKDCQTAISVESMENVDNGVDGGRPNEMCLTSVAGAMQTSVESMLSNSLDTPSPKSEELFPIFYPERWKPLEQQSNRRLHRVWCGGGEANQYQLDLGQQHFGAHQCKQCGLVYSVHEPEEEKLHQEYHDSLHVLRFKGWIDEDIVAIYAEWGADGRILRMSETSHVRRRERLADILKIVDKELGFSTYVIPNTFVAFLAVRKYQFVGLCLVQPLKTASKYVCINGVDCCSEEQFPAMCGISRIWVSPLHRRLRIASKLVQAVQQNTIFGQEIPLSQIAFSAPTESGKLFAQRITQQENFLVYQ